MDTDFLAGLFNAAALYTGYGVAATAVFILLWVVGAILFYRPYCERCGEGGRELRLIEGEEICEECAGDEW